MQYCCVLGIRGYQLLTYWEAQTVLRLMGMLDSFNWRQTYDAHTCLSGKRLLHQQKSPLRRPWKVAGAVACALRNFCGRGGNRQSKEHGSTHFPSGRVVVGVGQVQGLLVFDLLCWRRPSSFVLLRSKQGYTDGMFGSQCFLLLMETSPRVLNLLRIVYKVNVTISTASYIVLLKISRVFNGLLLNCSQFIFLILIALLFFLPFSLCNRRGIHFWEARDFHSNVPQFCTNRREISGLKKAVLLHIPQQGEEKHFH